MNKAFITIETYLLPTPESRLPSSSAGRNDLNATPNIRLDQTLFQVALADHIRSMQTMYRDTYDEQCLVRELRFENGDVKLPIKHLLEKIVEGRSRSIGLLKLCFGPESIEVLRGTLDLASSYALQGMWPQVNEKLVNSRHLISVLTTDDFISSHELRRRRGIDAARLICCVYRVLREWVMRNNGQVKKLFVRELLTELSKVPLHFPREDDDPNHPSALCSALYTFFVTNPPPAPAPSAVAAAEPHAPKDRHHIKALSTSYFPDPQGSPSSLAALAAAAAAPQQQQPHNNNTNEPTVDLTKSWGEVVDFLRSANCPVMKSWSTDLDSCLLPQNRASLALAFRQCDLQHRNVAHPVQLSHFILRFPATAKLLAGTKLTKLLAQIPVQLPLTADMNNGELITLPPPGSLTGAQQAKLNFLNQARSIQNLVYELPITMEEFLSHFVIESDDSVPLELLKVQALTLQGISSIYTPPVSSGNNGDHSPSHHGHQHQPNNNGTASPTSPIPAAAEDCLTKALNLLESCGLEMTVVACELYNSIAQLMIMKQRHWVASRKQRIKEELDAWIDGSEGKKEIKQQGKVIRKQFTDKNLLMSGAEVELRAKNFVVKKRIKYLSQQQEDQAEMNRALEAAYRYLVKSFEILEDTHGSTHPSVSTACLAVASVQNILGKYEDTREWLVRGLRYMEKHIPLPIRAITFTQTQLSQVLFKLGHDDEARRVLAKAASFHIQQAQTGIAVHNSYHTYHLNLVPPPGRQQQQQQQGGGGAKADPTKLDTARSNASSMQGEPGGGGEGGNKRVSVGGASAGGAAGGGGMDENQQQAFAAANFIPPPILKGTPLHEEVDQAVDLTSKAIKMNAKSGDKWVAAQLSEDLALLMESAFGWDSVQAAEGFKNVGIRCAAVSDWNRAVKYLKQAYDSHEVLYGKRDPRTLNVGKLLSSVKKSRSPSAATAVAMAHINAAIAEGAGVAAAAQGDALVEGEEDVGAAGGDHLNLTDDDMLLSPLAEAAFPIHGVMAQSEREAAAAATLQQEEQQLRQEDERVEVNSAEHRQYVFPVGMNENDDDEEDYGILLGGSAGAINRKDNVHALGAGVEEPTSPLSSHSGGSPRQQSGINLVRAMARSTAASQLQQL